LNKISFSINPHYVFFYDQKGVWKDKFIIDQEEEEIDRLRRLVSNVRGPNIELMESTWRNRVFQKNYLKINLDPDS